MSLGWRQWMHALCSVACLFGAGPALAESLRVGYFDLPPHTGVALQGGQQGLALQYFQRVSAQMGIEEVSVTGYPLARLLYMLQEERLDMALFLGKTPEREASLSYAREPLLVTTPVVAVTQLQPLRQIRTVEDLLPLRLGAWQNGYRSPMLQDPRLQVATVSSEHVVEQSLRMLMAGRIDGFYFPDLLAVRYEVARTGSRPKSACWPCQAPAWPCIRSLIGVPPRSSSSAMNRHSRRSRSNRTTGISSSNAWTSSTHGDRPPRADDAREWPGRVRLTGPVRSTPGDHRDAGPGASGTCARPR